MTLLISSIFISMIIQIFSEYKKNYSLIYIFKPLTTILITNLAICSGAPSVYKNLIITGLIFSLFGNIFLMLRNQKFVLGLISFLIAHIFYAVAFSFGVQTLHYNILVILLAIGAFIYSFLHSSLKEMKVPVLFYLLAIVVMAWMAWERNLLLSNEKATYAVIGASFFMLSDTILAIDRFKFQHKFFIFLIMVTYFLAQTLIALSV